MSNPHGLKVKYIAPPSAAEGEEVDGGLVDDCVVDSGSDGNGDA
eukprot:CAMPEP_0175081946 /NCGR_PEP_ID=MMETSP0052_2-20121109/26462_1 /TAXON_ID=51329 ORGANISM="Polytomella parva, Strain SAG 63-3" /NCGR_SAMPLE_ID=MMETSP0052_2 /ASSEMBLY_ACC=CAM_ASM_000194 /LENGTH=43 /DNA_ID= /DNA_START= /DNA_END= /DNA_ORIENTATION=